MWCGNKGLGGTIPPGLGDLNTLTGTLTLAQNQFTGTIPPELAKLTKLETLNLRFNKLNGCLPRVLDPARGGLCAYTMCGLDARNRQGAGGTCELRSDAPDLQH